MGGLEVVMLSVRERIFGYLNSKQMFEFLLTKNKHSDIIMLRTNVPKGDMLLRQAFEKEYGGSI